MDAETYPSPEVQDALVAFVVRKVDVRGGRGTASMLEVAGVPTAVALAADGTELGRIVGKLGPHELAERLRSLIGKVR